MYVCVYDLAMRTEHIITDAPTITAGALVAYLSTLPPDQPIVFYSNESDWYHNVEGWTFDPDEDVAVTLNDGGPMDTRQW